MSSLSYLNINYHTIEGKLLLFTRASERKELNYWKIKDSGFNFKKLHLVIMKIIMKKIQ